MKKIQEWHSENNYDSIRLCSDKIVLVTTYGGNKFHNKELTFEKFFLRKPPFLSVEEDYPIFKKVV